MDTVKLCVVGSNIAYSQSPRIHSEFGKNLSIPIDYGIQDIAEGSFSETIQDLQKRGLAGCNITVPYKEAAYALADESSTRATEAEAANTFIFKKDHIFADNTDGVGFIRDISQNIGFTLTGRRIVICGAGGAARGILPAILATHPAKLVIANRSIKPFPYPLTAYEDLANHKFDVLIDATSLRDRPPPIPSSLSIEKKGLVYDLKYSPKLKTPIMHWAEEKGVGLIFDGIGMLVEQAAEAFYLWTGKHPETQSVIAKLREDYAY